MSSDEKHGLHVEIPMSLWNEFKEVVPESGVTSVIVRRLIRAYVTWAKDNSVAIDFKNLTF